MIDVHPFRPDHIGAFTNHAGQEHLVEALPAEELDRATSTGAHYTLKAGSQVVACMGVVHINDYRASAWTLLQRLAPARFISVHRAAWHLLRIQPYMRIEAYVDPTMAPATRWMRMLGFRLETPYKPFFFPDGRGAAEWVLYPGKE